MSDWKARESTQPDRGDVLHRPPDLNPTFSVPDEPPPIKSSVTTKGYFHYAVEERYKITADEPDDD